MMRNIEKKYTLSDDAYMWRISVINCIYWQNVKYATRHFRTIMDRVVELQKYINWDFLRQMLIYVGYLKYVKFLYRFMCRMSVINCTH